MSIRFLLLLCVLASSSAQAADISLATASPRQSLMLTIYNAQDLTLVQETRAIDLQAGANALQFSWNGNQIDPTSVTLQFVNPSPGLEVTGTRFSHAQPHQLRWRVHSPDQRSAQLRISYFTAGIHWSAHYHAIMHPASDSMALIGDVQISNQSGEDYPAAAIRLVVGHVNLLEKIAELAGKPVSQLSQPRRNALRGQAAKAFLTAQARAAAAAPPAISRQPLSAYHLYRIAGRHTIRAGWRVRLRNFRAASAHYQTEYRYQPPQYGSGLVRVLLWRNAAASGLGDMPLPGGRIQVYQEDPDGELRYLNGQRLPYTPVGDQASLSLGSDPQVQLKTIPLTVFRDNIWLKLQGTDVYRRANEAGLKVDLPAKVAGWDRHETVVQRIRNGHHQPIQVRLRLRLNGDVTFRSQLNAKLYDAHTVQVTATAAAGSLTRLRYEVIRHQGHNQHQDQVSMTTGAPSLAPANNH